MSYQGNKRDYTISGGGVKQIVRLRISGVGEEVMIKPGFFSNL